MSEEILQPTKRRERHGMVRSPEYRAWCHMKERCYSTKDRRYADYGGRGIRVCERWRKSFSAFLEDMGLRPSPEHSLDRHPNNDGDYEPGNCRWATRVEQARNNRHNVWITFGGESLILEDWARRLGLTPGVLSRRLKLWPLALALTSPKDPGQSPEARARFIIEYNGLRLTKPEWASRLGIRLPALNKRLRERSLADALGYRYHERRWWK